MVRVDYRGRRVDNPPGEKKRRTGGVQRAPRGLSRSKLKRVSRASGFKVDHEREDRRFKSGGKKGTMSKIKGLYRTGGMDESPGGA